MGLIMSFGLAIYQTWIQQPYFDSLEAQGKGIGIGETAMGFFGAWLVMTLLGYYITKNMVRNET